MQIKIAERLHPFSHTPGVSCIIPNTTVEVQIFPVLLRFKNLYPISAEQTIEYRMDLKGPFRNFTVVQDLEKMCIQVFGHSAEGYVRYLIVREERGIAIVSEKSPDKPFRHLVEMPMSHGREMPQYGRLSLGISKAQDWDLVARRKDLKEIFPVWFRLGQMLSYLKEEDSTVGTLALLRLCEDLVFKREKNALSDAFLNLFNAGFNGILVPRLSDEQFQGLIPEVQNIPSTISPLVLLKKGAALIRSLFFEEGEDRISFLPCLPAEFDCGRLIDLQGMHGDEIDMEWSKKVLRRLVIRCKTSREVLPLFQKAIKKFRLRRSAGDRGQLVEAGSPICLKANETLFLDRFQK